MPKHIAIFPHCLPPADHAHSVATPPSDNNTRPVTLLSDEEPGPEDASSPGWLDYRLQRLRMMRRRYAIEDWEREERWSGLSRLPPDVAASESARDREGPDGGGMYNLSRLDALMARSRVRSATPEISTSLVRDDASDSTVRPTRPSARATASSTNLITHNQAHGNASTSKATFSGNVHQSNFHIRKGKHKVTMNFNPPLSGRFLLLKLWSAAGKSNVDVQSVIAMGYGGGRFFPAVEVR